MGAPVFANGDKSTVVLAKIENDGSGGGIGGKLSHAPPRFFVSNPASTIETSAEIYTEEHSIPSIR